MALAKKKLLTSLAVGGAVGVASLASMTSSPGVVKTADVAPKAPVVKSAPCPAGTVETTDACVRQVKVPAPAPRQATTTQTRTYTPTQTTPRYEEQEQEEHEEHGRSEEKREEHESESDD